MSEEHEEPSIGITNTIQDPHEQPSLNIHNSHDEAFSSADLVSVVLLSLVFFEVPHEEFVLDLTEAADGLQ